MRYISVLPYWVIDELEKGRLFFVTNKEEKEIVVLNDLDVGTAVELMKDAKAHSDKYDFWYEEEEKEESENVEEL